MSDVDNLHALIDLMQIVHTSSKEDWQLSNAYDLSLAEIKVIRENLEGIFKYIKNPKGYSNLNLHQVNTLNKLVIRYLDEDNKPLTEVEEYIAL